MKHVPMRMCIQTRERKPKSDLVRFVIDPEKGELSLDTTGKARARGANLSSDLSIFDKAVDSGAFERALDCDISSENYDRVRADLARFIKKKDFRKGRKKVSVRVKGDQINLG